VVENFKKIVITFNSTNKAYRYLRLTGIDFGQLIYFEGEDIRQAAIVEDVDLLSGELRVNTLDLPLHSTDPAFSIINPTGVFARLSERQPLSVYENIDTAQVFMGRYYLDTWRKRSDSEFEFHCVDLLGILDRIPYRGGMWTGAGTPVQTLIAQMMESIGIPYDLDLDLYDVAVVGWLPASTYREALQQIAFAVGAYVDCSRSNLVKIYKTVLASAESGGAAISRADKGLEQLLQLKPLVTGVEVTAHNYVAGTETETVSLFDGTLEIGTYEIIFSQPVHTLSVTGASISAEGVNYAVIEVAVAGAVTLSGLAYIDTKRQFSRYTSGLSSTTTPNIMKVDGATLVHSGNGQSVCDRIYTYYQQRYEQALKLYAPLTGVGTLTRVETVNAGAVRGVIEKMEIDLAGGMVVKAKITGVVDDLD